MILLFFVVGYCVFVFDLIGFGCFDKLICIEDYIYLWYVEWVMFWFENFDLYDVMFFV